MHLPSKRGIEYFQLSMFPTNRGICFSFKLTRMNRLRVGFWRSYSIAILELAGSYTFDVAPIAVDAAKLLRKKIGARRRKMSTKFETPRW